MELGDDLRHMINYRINSKRKQNTYRKKFKIH